MKPSIFLIALALLASSVPLNAASDNSKKIEEAAKAGAEAKAKADKEKADAETKAEKEKAEKEKSVAEAKEKAEKEKAEAETKADKEKAQEAEQAAKPEKAETEVQSSARPFDLDIIAPVQIAASDEASKIFSSEILPEFLKVADSNLAEQQTAKDISAVSLDPNKLTLKEDSTIRVYFVAEGAMYHNTLGFSTTGGGVDSPDASLIFPDASSNQGLYGDGSAIRTSDAPLLAGDFVDLGKYKAGTKLDFFLIANGAFGGKDVFSTNDSLNHDGIVHAISLYKEGSAYLLFSFEDIFGGGDGDYNDLVFAVEIKSLNSSSILGISAPEPSMALSSLLIGGLFIGGYRRRVR